MRDHITAQDISDELLEMQEDEEIARVMTHVYGVLNGLLMQWILHRMEGMPGLLVPLETAAEQFIKTARAAAKRREVNAAP